MIDHRNFLARDAFANQPGKGRCLLTIEICFEAMTDSFVKQNPRPSRAEHNFHLSRGGLSRVELNDRLACRLASEVLRCLVCLKVLDAHAPAATRISASGI